MNRLLLIDTREKPKAIESVVKTFESSGITYELEGKAKTSRFIGMTPEDIFEWWID